MAETITITRAEIITWAKNSEVVLKEKKTDKGATIFTFKAKTRVNDRVNNSPVIFRRFSYFAKTDNEASTIKQMITKGSILDIVGVTDRKNFTDEKDNNKVVYYDEINVKSIATINGNATEPVNNNSDLPF